MGIRGPQYGPQSTIVLTMGTPSMVPLIMGTYEFDEASFRK